MDTRGQMLGHAARAYSDEEVRVALAAAGISKTSAAAAVDVFRMVAEALENGTVTPRSGWAK